MNLWDIVSTPAGRGTVVEIQTDEAGDLVLISRLLVCPDGGEHRNCANGRARPVDPATAEVVGQYRPRGPVGWARNPANAAGDPRRWW